MSDISKSVLDSISTLVAPEIINYIQLVEYHFVQYYLAMGRTCFYFIAKDLGEHIDPPVPYSRIYRCRLDHKRKTLM
jgi:hypothetical protein